MPRILDSVFKEVTFFELKTETIFIKYNELKPVEQTSGHRSYKVRASMGVCAAFLVGIGQNSQS